ncbi:hypothetical protein AB0E04_17080 [Streptomyces sp. NPDC048251]|uniref:hypothetical protein n=1 Tax=Streptomyces sp. NPDC048251 TaxID=3154501 RepID=UPI00341BA06C
MTNHHTQQPRPGIRSRHGRPVLATIVAALLTILGLVTASPAQALSGDLRMHDPSVIKVGSCAVMFGAPTVACRQRIFLPSH